MLAQPCAIICARVRLLSPYRSGHGRSALPRLAHRSGLRVLRARPDRLSASNRQGLDPAPLPAYCAAFELARAFQPSFPGGSMLRFMAAIWVGLLMLAAVGWPAPTVLGDDEQVDLLLVLAADVSRSVDERKFRLQREGYATAMVDPRVVRAMTAGPSGRIALCFLEWSSDGEQVTIIDWTAVGNEAEAKAISKQIREAPRAFMGRTSISAAIDYSMTVLAHSPFAGPRRIIDVSGDGTNNSGRPVTAAR